MDPLEEGLWGKRGYEACAVLVFLFLVGVRYTNIGKIIDRING